MRYGDVEWYEFYDPIRQWVIWLHEDGAWTTISEGLLANELRHLVEDEGESVEATIQRSPRMKVVADTFACACKETTGRVILSLEQVRMPDSAPEKEHVYTGKWEHYGSSSYSSRVTSLDSEWSSPKPRR